MILARIAFHSKVFPYTVCPISLVHFYIDRARLLGHIVVLKYFYYKTNIKRITLMKNLNKRQILVRREVSMRRPGK